MWRCVTDFKNYTAWRLILSNINEPVGYLTPPTQWPDKHARHAGEREKKINSSFTKKEGYLLQHHYFTFSWKHSPVPSSIGRGSYFLQVNFYVFKFIEITPQEFCIQAEIYNSFLKSFDEFPTVVYSWNTKVEVCYQFVKLYFKFLIW